MTTASLPDPIAFVGGAPRSGTTLLRNMLAAHPLVAVPEESPFVLAVHRELARRGRAEDPELGWRLLRHWSRFATWQLDRAAVEAVLAEHPPARYADVVRALFAAYASSRGKPLSADKTTGNALAFEHLAMLFPSSRLVHVLRDPREVCMSLALRPWNPGGLARAALIWEQHVRRAGRAAEMLGERFIEIRYDELVAAPADVLTRLCGHLGVEFDPAMLDYPNSPDLLPGAHTRARESPQLRLRRWRDDLSQKEVALVELVAGRTMDRVGYERVCGRPTVAATAELCRYRLDRWRQRWYVSGAPVLGRALRQVIGRPDR